MNRDYIEWLKHLPVNRGAGRSIYDDYEPFEVWQARINERDARRGVIARWMDWLNS